jgi:universal stress protein A
MIAVKNVLVTIDFDQHTETVLNYARTLARMFGGRLHVLHVTENTFLRPTAMDSHALQASAVNQVSQRLTDADRQDLDARAVVRTSDAPAEEIVEYARDEGIDLIVMGTHGRKAVAHLLLGSVAERVVRTAPCPVLTVREPATAVPSAEGLAPVRSAVSPA